MISRRGLRTIRRRCLRSKTTLLFVALIALYFWRQRSLISTSDASYQREFELQHRDDYYAYQYGVGKNEKDDHGAKGILLEDGGNQENIPEELDAGQFEEEDDILNGFEKIKKNLGIEVEEEAEVEEEQNVRDLFQLNKAFQNGKSKQNALNKLKEILGLPPDDDDDTVYDGSLIADPIDKIEADDNEEEKNGGKKKGKLGKLKKKIKLKPLDFEIGEIDRDLPDVRPNECKHKSYPDNLPTASIIIVFYDEGLKTLLRTVHSIVNRSPPHLISEIILIDDYSTREHYTNELKVQLRQINYPIIIRRTKQRFGWVLARIQGAEYAKGDILIFLDAHTEVTEGWLEPICARIADDGHIAVFPIIDHIEPKTLEYVSESEHSVKVGVFDWSLGVTWQNKLTHGHDPTNPIPSPVMADAVFAINREYFLKLDGYDSFYTTEDTADLDLSFKIWMCGGSIELLPCSHVGHLHRHSLPFQLAGRGEINDKKRLAEIWFGEYKNFFYTIFPNAKKESPGDLIDEEALVQKLNCKTIYWYWETVYPESIWPVNGERYGELHHKETDKCLDIAVEENDHLIQSAVASVIVCDGAGTSQIWMLTSIGEIRNNFLCLESFDGKSVTASKCHQQKSNQEWMFDFSIDRIYHAASRHCLHTDANDNVILKECEPSPAQSWRLASRG